MARAWCAVLVAGLAASAAMTVGAAGLIQWSDGDGGSGTINPAGWNDIQAALISAGNNAPTPGTVKLSGDFARMTNDATVGSLVISNANITLSGGWDASFTTQSGRSILNVSGANTASNQFRVLSVTASNVVVQNVQAINGYTAKGGGAGILVSSAGPGVRLQNLVVTNNACPASYNGNNGGGIYLIEADAVRVSDCTISGNQTSDRGGGIGIYNNAVIPSAPVIIERCTIRSNKTISSNYTYGGNYGGGIDLSFSVFGAPNVVVANCVIDGNQSRYGSGINIDGYGGGSKATVFGCLITGNRWNTPSSYPGDGNGICVGGSWPSPARFVNCTVANNTHPTSPGRSGICLVNGGNQNMRGSFVNCVTKSNDFGFLVVRYNGSRVRYADFQNTTVQEGHYVEVDSAEATLTNATLAGAISTTGNPTPGYTGLDSTGGVTHAMQQNIDGSPNFSGLDPAPYQLTGSSANALDNGITKLDSRGFTYVDVDLNGAYTTNVDIIVAGTPPAGGPHLVYTTDLLGNPRVLGAAMDRGAYEMKTLSYSGTAFYETLPQSDGSISGSLTVTLGGDTFSATNNEDLVDSAKVTTANVPAGLQAVVTVLNSTQAVVMLTGNAANNTANDSITNLTVNFLDMAFGGGSAASVAGASRSDLGITFYGASANRGLTYSGTIFTESAANDGTIGNTVTVTVSGDTFLANPGIALANYPANLVPVVTKLNDQSLSMAFTGSALLQRTANNVTNLSVTFLDSAFYGGNAATVSNYTRADLQMTFQDPVLTYGGDTFSEAVANDGSVPTTLTLTLAGDTLNATNNENLVASGKVMATNVPAGLTAVVICTGSQAATASLTGKASPHNAANSVGNMTFAFQDAAFANGAAAVVTNGAKSNLKVSFLDPVLSYSGNAFIESPTSPGVMANKLTVTLVGDTLAGSTNEDLVGSSKVTLNNVPAGLIPVMTLNTSTQAVLALTGVAISNEAFSSITNLMVTFQNTAFMGASAAIVSNAVINLTVTFYSPSNWYVSVTGSDTNSGTLGNPFATVQKAINTAQSAANDVIHLLPGTYTQSGININGKLLTITGDTCSNTVLQAAATPFTANAGIIGGFTAGGYVRNLALQNGNVVDRGGALNFSSGTYYIDSCRFISNATTVYGPYSGGGAITLGENINGAIYLSNCQFVGNRSASYGGAIRSWNPTLWISNCTFLANSSAVDGGAVYAANGVAGSFYDSSFLGNKAAGSGGAVIYMPAFTAQGCTFATGTALNGGATCCASTPTFINCTFYGNMATNEGGAHYASNYGGLTAYNSTFFMNTALTGGAIRCSGASGGYILYSSIVASNTATYIGPDIAWGNNGNRLCYNCLIGNNANSGFAAGSPDVNTNYVGSATNAINPMLMPLADNGGQRLTCALQPDSPAIDHGSNPLGLFWDERGEGFARAYKSPPDMGAFEYGAHLPVNGLLLMVQ